MNVDIDKIEQIKKYGKYLILIVPIIIVMISLKSCGGKSYNALEEKVKEAATNYVRENNINIVGEQYIELTMLPEIEGTELCSEASGVLVKNENGSLKVTPYLNCNGYVSEVIRNKSKYVELNGDTIMLLNKGEVFNDPLYTLKKDADVEIEGYVGSSVGLYTINYYVYVDNELKETLYRKVIVTNGDRTKTISGIESVTEPTLTLYGDSEIVLSKGERYEEPGYKAVDYTDGKISRQVEINPKSINTNRAGIYVITYSVENSRGAVAIKTRTVNVVERKSNLNIELSTSNGEISNSIRITVRVSGNNYAYMILPDGTKDISRESRYEVKRNGTYSFAIYDSFGNKYRKEITIDNIDDKAPTGSCKAVVTSSATSVTVNATDNKGIGGYSYIIDGKATEYISNNTYEASTSASSVRVKVKDISGNEITLVCAIEEKLNDPDGIKETVSGKPRLQIPIETALAKKGHTVEDFNKCIYDRVKKAGPGTRYGVVAAAYGLIDCNLILTGYVLSYDHTGGKVHRDSDGTDYCRFNSSICGKIGINTRWGQAGGTCRSDKCYYGLNCATFVRWSMCNGGMDLCDKGTAGAFSMTNKNFFPEADGVTINKNSVKYYSGTDLTNYDSATLIRMLKPGDIAARERNGEPNGSSQHTFVIIGRDETGIYTANDGYYINKISYSSMIDGEYYYRLLFLDKYYENKNNRNSFYN